MTRKYVAAVLAVLCLKMFAFASGEGDVSAQGNAKPIELSIMTDWWIPTVPEPTWPIWQEAERRVGAKINMTFNLNFSADKIAVAVASGKTPDAMLINVLNTPVVYDWIRQGAFQPVEASLRQYAPALWAEAAPGAIQLGSVDGVLYGVPRPRAVSRDVFAIRTDWLNRLGLKPPRTIAELETVLRAFVEKDPDGNGLKDTIGLSQPMNPASGIFNAYLGTGNATEFVYDKSGIVVFNGIRPEAKEALATLQRWYKQGLIDPDVNAGAKYNSSAARSAARIGVTAAWLDQLRPSDFNPVPELWMYMRKSEPKAEWTMVPIFSQGAVVPKYYQTAGTSSHFFVSSKIKDPAKLRKLFEWWNFWASNAGYELGSWGVEGQDYVKAADGTRSLTEEGKKRVLTTQGFRQTHTWEAKMQVAADTEKNNKLMTAMLAELKPYSVPNPFIDVQSKSKAYLKSWNDLKKMQDEAYLKIIIGIDPLSSFDDFVVNWRKAGGDELLAEMNTIYRK